MKKASFFEKSEFFFEKVSFLKERVFQDMVYDFEDMVYDFFYTVIISFLLIAIIKNTSWLHCVKSLLLLKLRYSEALEGSSTTRF